MALSTPLRALAFDLVTRRDGLEGWKRHRDQFRTLATSRPDEVQRRAVDALRRLLAHAFATVPFYRDTWKGIGFTPSSVTTFDDLARLPVVLKADIRERKFTLVSTGFAPNELILDYTGGTTGTQTSFYRDQACMIARFGRQLGVLERCGYRPGDKRGLIWGAHADILPDDAGQRLKRQFRRFGCADEVKCCTVMGREDMLEYHRRLRRFRPAVLYGYPNAIEQFANFVHDERLAPITVERVICTAEILRESQRALFQKRFGGQVFNLYCSREHGCVGFECGHHAGFHIDSENVFMEILVDGRPAGPGESGEIVVTDLLNYGMPLIRYATGDLATAAAAPCACGSALPTFSALQGRLADTLHRPDGSTISGLMLTDLFMDEPAITHAQFVQHDTASLDVYLVANQGARTDLRSMAVKEVGAIMGRDMTIRVEFVPDIPRNPRSGKYQEVICRIRESAAAAPALSS